MKHQSKGIDRVTRPIPTLPVTLLRYLTTFCAHESCDSHLLTIFILLSKFGSRCLKMTSFLWIHMVNKIRIIQTHLWELIGQAQWERYLKLAIWWKQIKHVYLNHNLKKRCYMFLVHCLHKRQSVSITMSFFFLLAMFIYFPLVLCTTWIHKVASLHQ